MRRCKDPTPQDNRERQSSKRNPTDFRSGLCWPPPLQEEQHVQANASPITEVPTITDEGAPNTEVPTIVPTSPITEVPASPRQAYWVGYEPTEVAESETPVDIDPYETAELADEKIEVIEVDFF